MNTLYKKDNFYFWENLVKNTENILFGGNDSRLITPESIIIYIGIIDTEKDIFRSGWSSHEDLDTALGFLQHVFLPTCFYTWIDRNGKGLFIPLSPFEVLKEEVLKEITEDDKRVSKEVKKMEDLYSLLTSMWASEKEIKVRKLKEFSNNFNIFWNKEPQKKLFIKIFEKPIEIYDYIFEDEFEEVVEEEIEMSIEDFKFMLENSYDEPLINKNLIKTLNIKIPIWF